MADEDEFDLAVVGAGPAGAVAAFLAAKQGRRVALIDKRTFPRDKVCGDGISPATVTMLRDLGLASALDGEIPVSTIDIRGPDGARLNGPLPSANGLPVEGFVVRRITFDHRLYRAAVTAGAIDLTGHSFVATSISENFRVVTLKDKRGAGKRLHVKVLIGADGAYSKVREALGERPARKAELGIAMRGYAVSHDFDMDGKFGSQLGLEFSHHTLPGYGWIFPTGQGSVNVGIGVSVLDLRSRKLNLRSMLDDYYKLLKERGVQLGELRDVRSHCLPQITSMPKLSHPRAVLIGDAASMINPVSGEGIEYGIAAAKLLLDRLPLDLTASDIQSHLNDFERDFRRKYRAHFLSSLVAYVLLRNPSWSSIVLTAARRDPKVFRDSLELLFDSGRIKASTTLRILKSGWRR